ncbi:MAG: extracellular solute-binding protein [Ruminococcaceae bacterium]|nr:extracellular solute-binding protein [Oscillospiraceae bacterium]
MKDTRKTSRVLTALLATAMMTSLAACGGDAGSTDTTAASTDPVETTAPLDPALVCDLPDTDWEGRQCRILGYANTKTQFSNFEIDVEAENGEVVNDAIFRRNRTIEEAYNVEIVQTLEESDTSPRKSTLAHMRAMALAGEDLYDIAFMAIASIGTAAREGLFYDLNNVDYIDFSKDWWNPKVNNSLEIKGRLFFTNSDFTLRDKNRTYLITFNKRLVEEYSLGNYFDMVRDGTWTLDKMAEGCKAVANDINGDGKVDYYDTFGVVMDSYYGGAALAIGAGIRVLDNVDGEYQLVINNEHTINAFDKVLSIVAADRVGSFCNDWQNKELPFDSFWSFSGTVHNEGRALFNTSFPHGLKNKSAKSVDDYGVLPFPKYDEVQEDYYIYADPQGMLFGIPSTTPDPDFSGFMMEALSYESSTTSLPAYIEVSCKTKYTYDEDSAEMLDLIFDSIVFETAEIYGISGMNNILTSIMEKKTNNFATRYATLESAALKDLEKLVGDIMAVGNK